MKYWILEENLLLLFQDLGLDSYLVRTTTAQLLAPRLVCSLVSVFAGSLLLCWLDLECRDLFLTFSLVHCRSTRPLSYWLLLGGGLFLR